MKAFIVFVSVIVVARSGNIARVPRQSQNGWSSTPAPTQPGWSAPVNSGWSSPINTSIVLTADGVTFPAYGYGYAEENHAENVGVVGDDIVPADAAVAAGGDAIVSQIMDFSQETNTNADGSAASSSLVTIDQMATGTEGSAITASGLGITADQSGESVGLLYGQIHTGATASSIMNIAGESTLGLVNN